MFTERFSRARDRAYAAYADELSRRWQQGQPRPLVRTVDPQPALMARRERSLAIICHVFYPDLLHEVRAAAEHLPRRTDLFLSVVSERDYGLVSDYFSDWTAGDVVVRIVENRGRDIAPKYVAFADVYSRGYELLLFLHTKKSTNQVIGPLWRQFLFGALAGSRERVAGVLGLFDEDPALGVLAPEHFGPITPWIGWDGNYPQTVRIARRMGMEVRSWSPPDFPSGSMFWARPEALAPISRLRLRLADFPPEAAQIQSTVMHALERLVYLSATDSGYRSAVLRNGSGADVAAAATPVADAAPPQGVPPIRMRAASFAAVVQQIASEVSSIARGLPARLAAADAGASRSGRGDGAGQRAAADSTS